MTNAQTSSGNRFCRWIAATAGLVVVGGWLAGSTSAPAATGSAAIGPVSAGPVDGFRPAPADPSRVMGNESCVKCHAAEIDVWRRTPHAQTFDTLHRQPEAKQIAGKLGLRSIKHDGRCVACHYTTQADPAANLSAVHAISGVSCESCHGAARDWIEVHADYGGPGITRETESPDHRRWRIESSIARGMHNPTNVYSIARECLRCHTTGDEELVNVGGHTSGSLDFEFVSWSQGTIRHNFVRGGGTNAVATPAQRRLMFVAGMMAELEAGLRATAKATAKATYGVTAAQRTARTAKRLTSVAAKIDCVEVDDALRTFESVQLKLNNAGPLVAAADRIGQIGLYMASHQTGQNWAVLDRFIPTGVK